MTGTFQKKLTKRPKPTPKKPRPVSKKPVKPDHSKTPVTRVGDDKDHRDTISTRVLYVLVDQPKEPEDVLLLDREPQRWAKLSTIDAEPLYDTVLVFVIAFEKVADGGKFTLKVERGETSSVVGLFTDVESKDLFLHDIDLLFDFNTLQAKDVHSNRRVLDYTVIPPHPMPDDKDLGWPEAPYASLRP